MRIKKIMRRYFEGKLASVEEIEPTSINLQYQAKPQTVLFHLCQSDIFGYIMIIGIIIHYVTTGRLFLVGHILPSFGVLF